MTNDLVQIETPPIGPLQIEMDWDPAPLPQRVLLVNASHPAYNLGLEKAANWWRRQGVEVLRASEYTPMFRPETVWISAVFSWHVPALIFMSQQALSDGRQVEVGGPGTFGVREEIYRSTGLIPQSRPDPRFEREPVFPGLPGERSEPYKMVFWSRGCPARPGAFRQRWGRKKDQGRRARRRKIPYHLQPGYALITGTVRHCYVHPEREAILWEKNTQDASYKRPVCAECAE